MICEMALILAMDVSGSVSDHHYELQRDATADAITERIQANHVAPMAIQVIMWETVPHVVIPWSVLRTQSQVNNLAYTLRSIPRPGLGGTNMTTMMRTALDEFDTVPCEPERLVIDVSGDGASDEADMAEQRDRAQLMHVQVNGLPIVTSDQPVDVVSYYREQVATWDGFVIPANTWHDYSRAIRGKLMLEISGVRTLD